MYRSICTELRGRKAHPYQFTRLPATYFRARVAATSFPRRRDSLRDVSKRFWSTCTAAQSPSLPPFHRHRCTPRSTMVSIPELCTSAIKARPHGARGPRRGAERAAGESARVWQSPAPSRASPSRPGSGRLPHSAPGSGHRFCCPVLAPRPLTFPPQIRASRLASGSQLVCILPPALFVHHTRSPPILRRGIQGIPPKEVSSLPPSPRHWVRSSDTRASSPQSPLSLAALLKLMPSSLCLSPSSPPLTQRERANKPYWNDFSRVPRMHTRPPRRMP